MRCWALNLVVSNDTRTIRRGRSGRRTMGPSIDGGSRIGPSMPQQSARKYRNLRVKMTRPTPKTRDLRSRSDAHQVPLDYRRPFKIGNIVQTSVNALVSSTHPTALLPKQRRQILRALQLRLLVHAGVGGGQELG